MLDPYKMIFINIIASLLLLFGVLFYRFIYPKKKINLFALLIIITLLPCLSLLRAGSYESGDFDIHIYRSMEFFKSLTQGNLMPSWAAGLNAGYGYPLFIFNYTLPYYLVSLFHAFGVSFVTSLKLFIFTNFILSSIFAYLYARQKFKNEIAAFTVGIFYIFFPYHLVSAHFKVTIGELAAYTLIPLYFLFLDKLIETKEYRQIALGSIILSLIGISHLYIALFLIPLTLMYLVLKIPQKLKSILYFLAIFILSSAISAYQWLPTFIYKSYLYTSIHPVDLAKVFFPSLVDLLFSPWRYGLLFQGPKGEISYLLGYFQILTIAFVIYFYFKNKISKQAKNEVLFWLILFFVFSFLIIPQSKFIWQYLSLISAAGPQRLLLIVGFIVSVLGGFLATNIKNKKYIFLLVLFIIISTSLNWGQRRVIPQITDTQLSKNLPYSTAQGEGHFYAVTIYQNPKDFWQKNISLKPIENQNALFFSSISRSGTQHIYKIRTSKDLTIQENTLYFPGWEAFSSNSKLKLFPDKKGIININIPKGAYLLTVKYVDLLPFQAAKMITIFAFIFSILLILRGSKLKFPKP